MLSFAFALKLFGGNFGAAFPFNKNWVSYKVLSYALYIYKQGQENRYACKYDKRRCNDNAILFFMEVRNVFRGTNISYYLANTLMMDINYIGMLNDLGILLSLWN